MHYIARRQIEQVSVNRDTIGIAIEGDRGVATGYKDIVVDHGRPVDTYANRPIGACAARWTEILSEAECIIQHCNGLELFHRAAKIQHADANHVDYEVVFEARAIAGKLDAPGRAVSEHAVPDRHLLARERGDGAVHCRVGAYALNRLVPIGVSSGRIEKKPVENKPGMIIPPAEKVVFAHVFVSRKRREDRRSLPSRAFGKITTVPASYAEVRAIDHPRGAVVTAKVRSGGDMNDVARSRHA